MEEQGGSDAASGCSADSSTDAVGMSGAGSAQRGVVSVMAKQGQATAGGDRRRWHVGRAQEE
jgi:hypothetical protein